MKLTWEQPRSPDHELIWGSVGLIVLLATWTLPLHTLLAATGYLCPFRALTGLPCRTCGSTRAVMALSSLEFSAAFRLNPAVSFLWCAAHLYVPYALCVSLLRLPRLRISGPVLVRRRIALALLITTITLNWAFLLGERTGFFS